MGGAGVLPVRWLNLQEYQSKKLMHENGLHVQRFGVAENASDAVKVAKELSKFISAVLLNNETQYISRSKETLFI